MDTASELSARELNLADLRAGSLALMALFTGITAFIWFNLVAWHGLDLGPRSLAGWAGTLVLALASMTSYWLRERSLPLASSLLTVGVWLGVAFAQLVLPVGQGAYLFIVPVIIGSVLLGQRAVLVLAGMGSALALASGVQVWGLAPSSPDLWLPVAAILLVAFTAWLSVRNLYTALEWAWSGYERAYADRQVARAGQAELRRTLKALDEATYRLERANHMLAVARDQAEEARRLKQQFVQTISHELRTPLNLIVGFAELMAKSPEYYGAPLPAPYLRDLGIVHRNARHLQTLVNDVLDLARIDAAEMSILLEQVDPASLVQEAVQTARSLVESRGLDLRTEIEPGLPGVWLDPTRIRQVLFNLINNAARFTEQGSVTVAVKRQSEEVVFRVTDTGVGIAPADIPCIFDEFRQLDGTTKRRHGGVGLGLAISKRFVDLHGGRIWVESRVGQGSSFHFSLPLSRPDPVAEAGERHAYHTSTAPTSIGEKDLLLVVTRSPAAATLLSRYVPNCRTAVFRDLQQARSAAARLLPQGVLVDTVEHNLDSGAVAELAQEWSLPRTLFMACPLPGEDSLRRRLAVDGYIVKPVTQERLWDVLRPFGEGIDRVLVIDDEQDFVRLITRLLENPLRRYQVVPAGTGQEGLEQMARSLPDLVLLDLRLPDMVGSEVAALIRANPAWRQIPIIVVSAQEDMDDRQALSGTAILAKAGGLTAAEIVRWVGGVMSNKQ